MSIDHTWYRCPPGVRQRKAAGGVVARIEHATQRIVVALVNEQHATDFVLPKGGVERGETLEQAARREIAEEAGITDLTLVISLGLTERLNFPKTRWVMTHYFLFRTDQAQGKPTDRHHHYQLNWFDLDHLPPMFWPDQRELIEHNAQQIRDALVDKPPA